MLGERNLNKQGIAVETLHLALKVQFGIEELVVHLIIIEDNEKLISTPKIKINAHLNHVPKCSLSMAFSIIARCPTIYPI